MSAQRPISLSEAIRIAQARSPRIAATLADSANARAQAMVARAYSNPDVNLLYTRDPPRNHLLISQPIEYPWVRSAEIRSATALEHAARHSVEVERWSLRYDVEVAYAHAAALKALHQHSERSARDAREILRIARARGDGALKQLDVYHAAVTAGEAELDVLTDSIGAVTAVLDLQVLLGMDTSEVVITLSDSLPVASPAVSAPPRSLNVSIAELQLQAEEANVIVTRRGVFPVPSIQIGFDQNDPGEEGKQLLPVYGVTFTIPIWDRKRGDIAAARATRERAAAQLRQARLQTRIARIEAEKQRDLLRRKVEIGSEIVRNSEALLSLTMRSYREGTISLPDVTEAVLTAREAIRSYIRNLEAVRGAEAALIRAQVVGPFADRVPVTGTSGRDDRRSARQQR